MVLAIFWRWDPFYKMLFCMEKFPEHVVVISILQAFNCRCLRFLFTTIIIVFLINLKPRPIVTRTSLILIHESLESCFLLEVKLYETEGKIIGRKSKYAYFCL